MSHLITFGGIAKNKAGTTGCSVTAPGDPAGSAGPAHPAARRSQEEKVLPAGTGG